MTAALLEDEEFYTHQIEHSSSNEKIQFRIMLV